MKLPTPHPGLVVRYSFLWRRESIRGREEGSKERPCAIVLSTTEQDGGQRVYVLPVTHTPPIDSSTAVEVPAAVKRHLGLDELRSWIALDEVNDFIWPGFDLAPIPGSNPSKVDYGVLPPRFFDAVRRAFAALAAARRVTPVRRT